MMLINNVKELDTPGKKAEFIEYAELYYAITKRACMIEKICLCDTYQPMPIEELKKIGAIHDETELSVLHDVLGSSYSNYLCAVKTVSENSRLFQYVKNIYNSYRFYEQQSHMNDGPTIADFFCGAGGLSLGFRQTGFKIELANDIEEVCIQTYKYNHPEIPTSQIVKGDIKEIIDDIGTYIKRDIDVVVGGPPCQGFSTANKNHRVIDDPRNKLYKYYLKAVEKIVPKFVVMENVRGMLKVADQVVEDYQALRCHKGERTYTYSVAYRVFNSEFFSVAQSRERLIYIAIRNDIAESLGITPKAVFDMIESSNAGKTIFTLNDALKDIRVLDAEHQENRNEIDSPTSGEKVSINEFAHHNNAYLNLINENRCIPIIFNHKARYCSPLNYEIYRRLDPGDDATNEKIKDIMPYAHRNHCFKDKYYKLIGTKPCRTITAHLRMDCHSHIHPSQIRAITPREAARIQSFPDDYVFLGAYLKTYMQIGNAVPVVMARGIAKVIYQLLRSEKDK